MKNFKIIIFLMNIMKNIYKKTNNQMFNNYYLFFYIKNKKVN